MTDQGRYVHACHSRTGAARRHLQLTLPASGQPVRLARQVTREVLTAWGLAHMEETAILLVSELVTNAVRHAMSTDAITLELRVVQTWLRIESGSEFALVDCLAGKWGWIAWPASA